LLQKAYAPGSIEREKLKAALLEMKKAMPFKVPCVVNGQKVKAKVSTIFLTIFPSLFRLKLEKQLNSSYL
jgi:hypothetical protein